MRTACPQTPLDMSLCGRTGESECNDKSDSPELGQLHSLEGSLVPRQFSIVQAEQTH